MVTVEAVQEVTEALVSDVHRLLPQLSSSAPLPSGADLERLISSPCITLFIARLPAQSEEHGAEREPGPVVGMLTLVVFRIPTGVRSWVEDVVVDGSARGQGTGAALVSAALECAAAQGAQTVDLTSRPSREAANRLYVRMGFKARETNVYRVVLGG